MTEREVLEGAFPAVPITGAVVDEAENGIANYDRGVEARSRLVARTWCELDAGFIEDFHELPIYAGPQLFAAVLPAYLAFLAEHDRFSHALYVIGNQLVRKDDAVSQRSFDGRAAVLTAAQRDVVAQLIHQLAARPAMERALRPAVPSWSQGA